MSEYRDPIHAEVERLRAENAELRAMLPPSEPMLPYETCCPGCRKYSGVRTWNPSSGTGHFDCRCGTEINLSDKGCGCRWKELTAVDTEAVKIEAEKIALDAEAVKIEAEKIALDAEAAAAAGIVADRVTEIFGWSAWKSNYNVLVPIGTAIGVIAGVAACSDGQHSVFFLLSFPIGGAFIGFLIAKAFS